MGKDENGNAHAPQNLKVWREGMGYSIEDACKYLEVNQHEYTSWETEAKPAPRNILLACAALALGIKAA